MRSRERWTASEVIRGHAAPLAFGRDLEQPIESMVILVAEMTRTVRSGSRKEKKKKTKILMETKRWKKIVWVTMMGRRTMSKNGIGDGSGGR